MRSPRRNLRVPAAIVEPALAGLQQELDVPSAYPPEVWREAEAVAARGPLLPEGGGPTWADRRDLPLVTIDPAGSMDLDQALHLERRDGGFRVHYAIADVASFVTPGGALDADTWRRGVTLYLPDEPVRLHPPVLSEGAASLLPIGDRPAVLWRLDLDADGDLVDTEVVRAWVRSREQLAYPEAQARIDRLAGATDDAPGGLGLLPLIGRLRQAQEEARGGVSLQLPEQDVISEDGRYRLSFREGLAVEGWNAQLSLLTGMAAAQLMDQAGVGVVRVLPPSDPRLLEQLRRSARALGVDWPAELPYPAFVRRLDPAIGAQAALLHQAARTLRGAGYATLHERGKVPQHAAVAAPYAHVTAPLRRLVDRYGSEVALAVCAGREVPAWVTARLEDLPAAMAAAGQRSSRVDGAVFDLLEALVLADQVGARFGGTVIDANQHRSTVQLDSPAVVTSVAGVLPPGERVELQLVAADAAKRQVEFRPIEPTPAPPS